MKTSGEKLYRSRRDRWLGGVCGGVGHHFHLDPNVLRIPWLVLLIAEPMVFALLYFLSWLVIPSEPLTIGADAETKGRAAKRTGVRISAGMFWGILLVVLGTIFLVGQGFVRIATGLIAPVALLVLGILLIAGVFPHDSSHRREER